MKREMMKYVFLLAALFTVKESRCCFANVKTQSFSIKTGSAFYHECHCADATVAVDELRWLDPHGQTIDMLGPGTESRVYVERQDRSISLQIPRISKTLSGLYKCLATVDGKVHTSLYVIEAYDPLYFVATNLSQIAIKGKDSLIHCNARGESAPVITWYKDLNQLRSDSKYQIEANGLMIKNVEDDDNGTYKCSATVPVTGEDVDRQIEVTVLRLPVIIELEVTPNKTVIIGDSLSIECIATGLPHPQYYWNKTTDMLTIETWKTELNKITFDSVEPFDRGTYQCTAFNEAGATTKEVFIEVLEPAIITEFSNVIAAEESSAQIICKAFGRPAPTLTMAFEKAGADQDPSIIWDIRKLSDVQSMFILTFTPVKRSHEGNYTCYAGNGVESSNETVEMKVLYKPLFQDKRDIVWAWNGRSANLSCAHESNPASNISWRFLGSDLPTIEQVAMNRLIIPEEKQNSEYLIIDPVDGKSIYGKYECEATNDLGHAKKTIVLQEGFAPSVIRDLDITELTASSVTFDLKEPINITGSIPPIIGFTAEYDEEKNYEITTIHKNRTWSKDRPCQVDKLKPNTSYMIKFAALNAVGTGEWGSYLNFSTLERTIPELPIWENAKFETTEEYLVTRWKPAEAHDEVDYYVVKYCPVHNDKVNHHLCKKDIVRSVNSLSLEHLHLNTTYLLELVAHNSKGNSSTAELIITTPAIREAPPPATSATTMIGLSIVVVVICILALDAVLFCWRRQGLIATCYYRKNKKATEDDTLSRDKKGLLKTSNPSTMEERDRTHQEFEYNKTTGVITGKHSSV